MAKPENNPVSHVGYCAEMDRSRSNGMVWYGMGVFRGSEKIGCVGVLSRGMEALTAL